MTFDDVLSALQGLLGHEVLVGIAPVGDPVSFLTMTGVLERGVPSPSQEVLRGLGRELPGDEAVQFKVSPETHLTLSRRHFRGAGVGDDALGPDLWIEHAGTIINVSDAAAARAAAAAIRSKHDG